MSTPISRQELLSNVPYQTTSDEPSTQQKARRATRDPISHHCRNRHGLDHYFRHKLAEGGVCIDYEDTSQGCICSSRIVLGTPGALGFMVSCKVSIHVGGWTCALNVGWQTGKPVLSYVLDAQVLTGRHL